MDFIKYYNEYIKIKEQFEKENNKKFDDVFELKYNQEFKENNEKFKNNQEFKENNEKFKNNQEFKEINKKFHNVFKFKEIYKKYNNKFKRNYKKFKKYDNRI